MLGELATLKPFWVPRSLLDLGSGPGTATLGRSRRLHFAAKLPSCQRDLAMATLCARLAECGLGEFVGDLEWARGDAGSLELPASDLVVAGYLLGELGHDREEPALWSWWQATKDELVIIEPGTPAGFERLRVASSRLVSWGAHVTAPCPHDGPCPMAGSDWCHFAVRLERTSLHRELKGARLGYEDEKYAYIVVSPHLPPPPAARLVRSPPTQRTRAPRRMRIVRPRRASRQPTRRPLPACPGGALGDRLSLDAPL